MRQIAMRDFQQKGGAAIKGSSQEPILLSGREGPKYFLVPAQEEGLTFQFEELKRAQALANLRAWQLRARELGMDELTNKEIDEEIDAARKERRKKHGK
jgi:hypothetical protein